MRLLLLCFPSPNPKIQSSNPCLLPSLAQLLPRLLKMPLHNLLKNALAPTLNNIAMTRNNAVKIPLGNTTHARGETLPIATRDAVP